MLPRDVTTHKSIPVTTIARMLVDLTDELTAHQLANVIHEATFRRRFSLTATNDAIARANGRHNLDVLHKALALNAAGSAGTKSRNEDRFLYLLQLAGIPEPRVNTESTAPNPTHIGPSSTSRSRSTAPATPARERGARTPRTRRSSVPRATRSSACRKANCDEVSTSSAHQPRQLTATAEPSGDHTGDASHDRGATTRRGRAPAASSSATMAAAAILLRRSCPR